MLTIDDETYGSLADIADHLDLNRNTLRVARWRNVTTFPKAVGTIGNSLVYRVADVVQWHSMHDTPLHKRTKPTAS